jgi:diguanylate cyclase (GGDEF)-like protein
MTYRYSDCLRGLLDRDAFIRMLSVFGSATATVDADRMTAIIIEIDRAEHANARLDDATGDTLIRLMLGRTQPVLPLEALAARMRPNAIALLLFNSASDDVIDALCASIHEAIRAPLTSGGERLYLSASIGIAFTAPQRPPVVAMQNAERALERVKSNGGDATFVHRPHPLEVLSMEIAA